MHILECPKASNSQICMIQHLMIVLWQHSSTEFAYQSLYMVHAQGDYRVGQVSWECTSSGWGDIGSLNKDKQGVIYPPVYMGINPSGTKTLNSSLFYVDSNLHKPDGWGEGRSCVEQGDLSISGGLRVQAPLTSKAF